MAPSITDFMIHVDESLSEADMASLTDSVCNQDHVTSACVSGNDPHLIIVTYNASGTSAKDIVEQVKTRGVHAQAIGL